MHGNLKSSLENSYANGKKGVYPEKVGEIHSWGVNFLRDLPLIVTGYGINVTTFAP